MLQIEDFGALSKIETPFYYYDIDLFRRTADLAASLSRETGIEIHYSVKANSDRRLIEMLSSRGFGADCVSGDEIVFAVDCGFRPESIMFAGVGKTDKEIFQALQMGIGSFNVESLEEIAIIGDLAGRLGRRVSITLRINPNIDPHTHHYITTGLYEDKFGISDVGFDGAVTLLRQFPNIDFYGLQFHIGSQIMDVEEVFRLECERVNEIVRIFEANGLTVRNIDLGGGLGVDYDEPDLHPIPELEKWLRTIDRHLVRRPDQKLHVEPGRALVAQCASLVSRVIFVKDGERKSFVILDAGMNDLLRPALYGAYHKIENLTYESDELRLYDVVGPVCETTDLFAEDRTLPLTRRGDLVAIRSAGAYGAVMSSTYNMRKPARTVFSDEIEK
jgi:diaminopimelate decarboxylase